MTEPAPQAPIPVEAAPQAPASVRRGPPKSGTGFLYGWLLFVIFVEYTRPLKVLPFLKIPFLLTIIPVLLFLITTSAEGLRPAKDIFADSRVKWLFFFIGLIVLSSAMHGFDKMGTDVITRVGGYTLLFFLIVRLVTTERRLVGVIITLVLAHLYLVAENYEVIANPSLRQYLVAAPFLGDGNDFALSIGVLFPCIVGVALLARHKFGSLLAWVAAAIIPLSIVASQSRGATLGFGAVIIYLWLRSPKKMASAVGVLLLAGMVMLYAPAVYFERMGTVSTAATEDSSASLRLKAWSGSIGMAANRPLGLGAGHFGVYWGKTAHSTYFLALGELGVLGFICVLVLIFGNMRANWRVRKRVMALLPQPPPEEALRSLRMLDMINAGLVYFAVAGAFLSATYYPHIYVLFGMLLAAREFALRHAPGALSADEPADKSPRGARGRPPVKRLASASK
jgi:hypothetical protein